MLPPLQPSTSRFMLELEGQVAGLLADVEGGEPFATVICEPPDAANVIRKHLGPVAHEPLCLSFGADMADPLYQWIADWLDGHAGVRSGAVVTFDETLRARSRLEFEQASIAEIAFPALDAASRSPALFRLVLRGRFDRAADLAAAASIGVRHSGRRRGTWLMSNFRLSIDGLAISDRLVKLMGGELRVHSVCDEGSSFAFELALPAVDAPARSALEEDGLVAGYLGARRRVLVVDDKQINRKVLVGLLGPLGFECVEAVDGEDCLRQAGLARPDIVLMDIAMPNLDGLEAARRLRRQPGGERIAVVALSASVYEADREQCLQAGCDDFIPQPVQRGQLLDALARWLNLQWVYRQPEAPASTSVAAEPARLPPLPETQARALREAARKGHVKGIAEQVQALEALGEPFGGQARRIRELARQFRFDEIAELAER